MTFVQVHVLSWVPLSCVNRDDAGQPKFMRIGGGSRGRWSSQSQKYAVRKRFVKTFDPDNLAMRTKFVESELATALVEQGADEDQAAELADAFMTVVNLKRSDGRTETLIAVRSNLDPVAEWVLKNSDDLKLAAPLKVQATTKKAPKLEADEKTLLKQVETAITGKKDSRTGRMINGLLTDPTGLVDTALFGRMMAELPGNDTQAACSVAHAFTTHEDDYTIDYFTSTDDKNPIQGSSHIGQQGFNSGVFYRFACVSLGELREGGLLDDDMARRATLEFVREFAQLQPVAKRFGTAPYTAPSLILVTVAEQAMSYADAFVDPVCGPDLIGESIAALSETMHNKVEAFGPPGKAFVLIPGDECFTTCAERVHNFESLMNRVEESL